MNLPFSRFPYKSAIPLTRFSSLVIAIDTKIMNSLIQTSTTPMSTSDTSADAPFPRGLEHARRVRDEAREQYKMMQNLTRIKKNDRSMSAEQKYQRRLATNQASAAAGRAAHEAYLANLEFQVRAYDIDMTNMEQRAARVQRERDESRRRNIMLVERGRLIEQKIEEMRAQLALLSTQAEVTPQNQVTVPLDYSPVDQRFDERAQLLDFTYSFDTDSKGTEQKLFEQFGVKNPFDNFLVPQFDFRVVLDGC